MLEGYFSLVIACADCGITRRYVLRADFERLPTTRTFAEHLVFFYEHDVLHAE